MEDGEEDGGLPATAVSTAEDARIAADDISNHPQEGQLFKNTPHGHMGISREVVGLVHMAGILCVQRHVFVFVFVIVINF